MPFLPAGTQPPTMISLVQYRASIGTFVGGRNTKRKTKQNMTRQDRPISSSSHLSPFHLMIYFYVLLIYVLLGAMMNYAPPSVTARSNVDITGKMFLYSWYVNYVFIVFILLCIKRLSISVTKKCLGNLSSRKVRSFIARLPETLFSLLPKYIRTIAEILLVRSQPNIVNPGPIGAASELSIVYCNANGLIQARSIVGDQPIFKETKLKDLHAYLFTYSPDIVILNETWLNKHVHDSELVSDKYYTILRKDRSDDDMKKFGKKGGGGVMILYKSSIGLEVKQVNFKTPLPIVSIYLKSKMTEGHCISTFYRYDYSDSHFLEEADRYYTHITKKYKNLTIIGDLNLSSINDWNLPASANKLHLDFAHMFSSLGLTSLVNEPTHRDGNILDLVLTNTPSLFSNISIEENAFVKSDHFSIKCNFNLKKQRIKSKTVKKFAYKNANWENLNEDLFSVDWLNKLKDLSAEKSLEIFKSTLDILLRRHVPLVKAKLGSQPPWYDASLKQAKNELDKARKLSQKNPTNLQLKKDFKDKEASYRIEAHEKETRFLELSTVGEKASSSSVSKNFFKHIKSKTNSTRIPETVYLGKKFEKHSQRKCELFNEFFCAQFTEASSYEEIVDFTRNHSNDFNTETFYVDEIIAILKKTDSSKSSGPDNIDGIVLKKCNRSLAYPLSMIFNKVYDSGEIPSEWKMANVVPIHKKGDKSNVENYRPISLTSLLMKVFEKLVRERLYRVCLDKITPRQHGFMPLKSCTSQLLDFNCHLALDLNNRGENDIVFFDFQKAFDSVSHDVILEKVKNEFNINGKMLRFLTNYLAGRQQRVVLDGSFSDWAKVNSGVPQGSILGPFLFVLFINDIVNVVRDDTNILLYADDLKIWRAVGKDKEDLQQDIDNLLDWATLNKMKFHPDKCKFLKCTLKRKITPTTYQLGESEIKQCENETDLGVVTTEKLTMVDHQRKVLAKFSQRLGLVRRVCSIVESAHKRRTLYISLVRSLIEHCSQVWSPVTKSSLQYFEKLQKRAIKWILDEEDSSYDTATYISKLKNCRILPMEKKFLYNDLKLFHKIFNGISPISFPPFIQKYDPATHSKRSTRQQSQKTLSNVVCTERPKVNAFSQSYFYRSHLEWNKLPTELRDINEHDTFAVKLMEYLWEIT